MAEVERMVQDMGRSCSMCNTGPRGLIRGTIKEIIGGHEAQPHSRPYMVIVALFQDGEWKRCGGFLVEEDIVLTAAHCWGSPMDVFLGVHDILLEENTWQNIDVKKAIPHPKYSNKTDNNDIMILQLDTKAQLTAAVGLIRLPGESDHVRPGQVCSLAGWGNISDSERTTKLHEVDLVIQEDFQCESREPDYDRTTELCVGDPEKKMCSSEGDSGGPLVCRNVAQGISTSGRENPTSPCFFTKISSFLPWIKKTIKVLHLEESP
ncbi:PREDICTED: granzyme H-like [Elephantulus edwardii]|uniref:granzyme H-like n=1 Tax=Elephantulus edwardii TaxID=28737 RepID=UPI0003F0E78D|nr:PREDICTED: granzyme H-like [Elephantulus edwardii]